MQFKLISITMTMFCQLLAFIKILIILCIVKIKITN